ncbi:MAG: hypothetical protein R2942_19520 [Ignavibacteria bacterium]
MRTPDGSADIYHLLAGIIMAAQYGLEWENALERAKELFVDVNIFKNENKDKAIALEHLPVSCSESADALFKEREF